MVEEKDPGGRSDGEVGGGVFGKVEAGTTG